MQHSRNVLFFFCCEYVIQNVENPVFAVCLSCGKGVKKSGSDHHRNGDWQLVGFVTFVVTTVSAILVLVDEFYCSYDIFSFVLL